MSRVVSSGIARWHLLIGAALMAVLLLTTSGGSYARAADAIVVMNNNDNGPGSLRDAIDESSAGDTITFDANVNESILLSSELVINNHLTIEGPGADILALDGQGTTQVLKIDSGTVYIYGLTMKNGGDAYTGGGISNKGSLTLTNSTVSGNTASNEGGGIYNERNLTLINSTVSGNTSNYGGGGIMISGSSSTLSLINSTISGNTSEEEDGGGVYNLSGGTITLTNSTVSGNTAREGKGGGIYYGQPQGRPLALTNSTVSGNSAEAGGGIWLQWASLDLTNTIIANNQSGGCGASGSHDITSMGHNLDSDNTCGLTDATDEPNTNPLLGPLQDNGGPTLTHALLAGSPAIDAIPISNCDLNEDQRGEPRPQGTGCDIGAFEADVEPEPEPEADLAVSKSVDDASPPEGGTITFSVSVTNNGPDTTNGVVVTDALPSGLTFQSSNPGDGTYSPVTGNWALESPLSSGASATLTLVAIVDEGTEGSTITNTASVTASDQGDPDSGNDTASAALTVAGQPQPEPALEVTNLNDSGDGSLRDAIYSSPGGDTITFADDVTGAILLASQLVIDKDLTINGPGADVLALDGQGSTRVLTIDSGTVYISGLTIKNGSVHDAADANKGGGILNTGTLTLNNATISGNTGDSFGGGIFNDGALVLTNSTVSGNNADYYGGGIYNTDGTLTLTNSTVNGNTSGQDAGGIYNTQAILTLTNSTVSGNTANIGGGIENMVNGTVSLINTTVTGNIAASHVGSGIRNPMPNSSVALTNSIISNSQGGDCDGTIASVGHNLDSDGTCGLTDATDKPNTNPMLGPLQDNGGPTLTHALLAGSPAIDAIPTIDYDNDGSLTCKLIEDQRGYTRPQGDRCDIGAFEFNQGWTDCSQSMYVANEGNGGGGTTVMEVDCYGTVSTFGTGLGGASGVVTDGEYLWVSDDGTGTPTKWIHRLDASGAKTSVSISSLGNPNGLSIDSSGRLLVADSDGHIRRLTIDDTGTVTNNELLADFSEFPMTQGVMGEVDGDVLFVDSSGFIYRITPSMTLPVGPTTTGLQLSVGSVASGNQGHIALDASGNIYTTNSGARIIRVDSDGTTARNVVNIPDASACDSTQAGMGGGQPAFRGITFTPDWDLVATGYCLDNVYVFSKSDIDGAWFSSTPIATLPEPFVQNPSGAFDEPYFNGPFGVVFAALHTKCQGLTPTDSGTSGNDIIIGTSGNDVIHALGGDDVVLGMGGNDVICLGDGDDFADGGPGKDRIYGENGDDDIRGGDGKDRIWGGAGEDMIRGGRGKDRLYGGAHDDMLKGGKHNDRLYGEKGNDTLVGGKDNDQLYGNKGDDVLLGRSGNDSHNCGPGYDWADGGSGADTQDGSCQDFLAIP